MDLAKASDIVKKLIPEIKAQLGENVNVAVHIGDVVVYPNFPPQADLSKVSEITPEMEERIAERIFSKLKAQEDRFKSLSEPEQLQTITDVTSGTILEAGVHESFVISEFIDAEIEKKKP